MIMSDIPSATRHPIEFTLLDRYLAHDASADERAQVERWIAASPDHAILVAVARAGRRDGAETTVNVARGLARLDARLDADRNVPHSSALAGERAVAGRSIPGMFIPVRRTMLRNGIAGLVALVGAIAILPRIASWRSPSASSAGATYTTPIGQQATITLLDGSVAQLAPGSTLRVAPGFNTTSRTLWLSGEARFDVHSATQPFIVRTSNAETRVLGTVFNVRQYDDDHAARVSVTSGRVSIAHRTHDSTDASTPVLLTAGMSARVTDSVAIAGDSATTSWDGERLIFREAPLTDVLATLTRWYGYRFQCTDTTLAHQQFTLRLSTQSASVAFTTLERILEADLTVDRGVVTIRPKRTPIRAEPEPRFRKNIPPTSESEVGR